MNLASAASVLLLYSDGKSRGLSEGKQFALYGELIPIYLAIAAQSEHNPYWVTVSEQEYQKWMEFHTFQYEECDQIRGRHNRYTAHFRDEYGVRVDIISYRCTRPHSNCADKDYRFIAGIKRNGRYVMRPAISLSAYERNIGGNSKISLRTRTTQQ